MNNSDLWDYFYYYLFCHILEINRVYITFIIKRTSEDYIKNQWASPMFKSILHIFSLGRMEMNHHHAVNSTPKYWAVNYSSITFICENRLPFATFGWVSTISETHTLSRAITCTRGMLVCFNWSQSWNDLIITILIPVLNSILRHWCAGCTMCALPRPPFPIWCISSSLPSTNICIFDTYCIMQQI